MKHLKGLGITISYNGKSFTMPIPDTPHNRECYGLPPKTKKKVKKKKK